MWACVADAGQVYGAGMRSERLSPEIVPARVVRLGAQRQGGSGAASPTPVECGSEQYLEPVRDGFITIEVETPQGSFVRTIRPATLLPEGVDRGPAAEAATRGAAALYGLPDFVFHPALERRGPGVREIGDALLIAGRKGAAVQVKARQQTTDNPERERTWLARKATEGTRQATGTIRRLRYPQETRLENVRGDIVSIWGRDISWVPVVVMEHPPPPEDLVLGRDAVILLRRDWEFLFEQLQSTVAVIDYLLRVAPMDPVALGMESLRYYELAQADAAAVPTPADPAFADLVMRDESTPFLPLRPANRSNLIRWILEDVGEVPTAGLGEERARHRLAMLAAIDSAPIATREQMAETILSWFEQVRLAPPEAVWWRFRHYLYFGRVHLIVGVTNQNREEMREAFGHLMRLRHMERGERSLAQAELMTVGVLLQPRDDGRRPWDTTAGMVEGVVTLEPEERGIALRIWGSIAEAVRRGEAANPDDPFARAQANTDESPG